MAQAVAVHGDVFLYEEDVATLGECQWLGDLVIAFFWELFAARLARDEAATSHGSVAESPRVLLIEPTVSYMAAVFGAAEALREVLAVPRTAGARSLTELLLTASLVLVPVSDKADPDDPVGGGHWSLLVFRRDTSSGLSAFEHYDSAGGANADHAAAVATALGPLLSTSPPPVQLVASPQQVNGHDCGVYAVALAELLCALFMAGTLPPPGVPPLELEQLTPKAIAEKRAEMRRTVSTCRPPAAP